MPIYDITCSNCGHKWEARIYKSSDKESEMVCHKCGTEANVSQDAGIESTSFRIAGGFAARNRYGLKKFKDPK